MKKLLLVLVVLCCFDLSVSAKIFRVGFPGTPVAGVDYAPDQASIVVGVANAGDTIQVYQQYSISAINFGDITKSLVFIGFGYFLNKNPNLQAVTGTEDYQVYMDFAPGSEGSIVQGVAGWFNISADNITVSRCFATVLNIGYNRFAQAVDISGTIIKSSFILELADIGHGSNLYIANNVIRDSFLDISSGFYVNNVITGAAVLHSFLIKNNIFIESCFVQNGSNIWEYNVFGQNCNYTGTGNQYNVNMATVFSAWSSNGFSLIFDNSSATYRDNQLGISPTSPTLNAGRKADGSPTDAGIYGGEAGDIYRLSGIPSVPSIYKLTSTSSTAIQNPYNITVSVRSNN